jgi:hypothetical protein
MVTPLVTFKINRYIAKTLGLASTELTGTIDGIDGSNLLFTGHAVVRESKHCLMCGTEITNPVSILVGYGPYCSERVGIGRPESLKADELAAAKARAERASYVRGKPIPIRHCTFIGTTPQIVIDSQKIKIWVQDNYILLKSPWSAETAAKCGKMGLRGSWNTPHVGVWQWAATPTNAAALINTFNEQAIIDDSVTALTKVVAVESTASGPKKPLRIQLVKGHITLKTTGYDDEVRRKAGKEGLKGIFNDKKFPNVWSWDANPVIAFQLVETFGARAEVDAEVLEMAEQGKPIVAAELVADSIKALDDVETHAVIAQPAHIKTTLWPHQLRGWKQIADTYGRILLYEMGAGKTLTTVTHIVEEEVPTTLVVCPDKVITTWGNEFAKHASIPVYIVPQTRKRSKQNEWAENTRRAAAKILVVPLSRLIGSVETKARHAENLYNEAKARGQQVVFVINYESAVRAPFSHWMLGTQEGGTPRPEWDCVVLDECQRLGTPKTLTGRTIRAVRKNAVQVIGLSGTLLRNGPLDFWGVAQAIVPHLVPQTFGSYQYHYAITELVGANKARVAVAYRNQGELAKIIKSCSDRVRADDVLSLPPIMPDVEMYVQLSPSTMKMYRQLVRESVAELQSEGKEPEFISADAIIVQILRLQQLACGHAAGRNAEGDSWDRRVDTAKMDALGELLDDLPIDEPLIVFYQYTETARDIREVCEQHGRGYYELSGRTNAYATNGFEAWKAGGDEFKEWGRGIQPNSAAAVIAVQIASGEAGIDLTRGGALARDEHGKLRMVIDPASQQEVPLASQACYVVYYTPTYSPDKWNQSRKRAHRPGQERRVTHILLKAEGTIDDRVYARCFAKAKTISALLDGDGYAADSIQVAEDSVAREVWYDLLNEYYEEEEEPMEE